MTAGQSLAEGAAGLALLHLQTGNWPAAYASLREATTGGVSIAEAASLFYGAPALAFVLADTDHPGLQHARAIAADGTAALTRQRLNTAHRRIDQQQQPHYAEYDLIRGLTGLGVTLRRLGTHDRLLRDVLDYLVRLTEPIAGLPGWWSYNGPERSQPPPPGGHANFGMAHGITGPLALLALTHREGVVVDGHLSAITRICRWLDLWQQHTDGGSWWPQTITRADLDRGAPAQRSPLRPSWCYGTPGIARAQQLAALTTQDKPRRHLAETAFASCINDPHQIGRLTDRGLCHGTAGLLACARRLTADAINPLPLTRVEDLHQTAVPAPDEAGGLLDGAAGAALAAVATTSWDACLLLT